MNTREIIVTFLTGNLLYRQSRIFYVNLPEVSGSLASQITDNFELLKSASSN